MRAPILTLLLGVLSAGSLLATDITPAEAAKHVGEKVTVKGTVVQAVYSPGLAKVGQIPNPKNRSVYLNFGAKYPDHIFSVAVLAAKTPALLAGGPAWLTELQGKEIAVTGTIELYEGKPEIVLTAKEDIVSPAK
ncbi:MAG TPA: hypothetical protein VGL72_16965 [Bryobacteraceae bacterium]|jgi:DNA/RNA endonuclease YhcR with UshA esterase domain